MDTYALEKFTGWTPELSPPEGSPLYRWRELAGEVENFRPTLDVAGLIERESGDVNQSIYPLRQ